MKNTWIAGGAIAGLAMAGAVAGTVSAQSVADVTTLSEDEVIAIALAEISGEVSEAELEERRGRSVWDIEIIDEDGNDIEIRIAADSGDILNVKAEGSDCDSDDDDEDDNGEDA